MPNVVIIGSNSFTGSHFCKYLIKKKFTIIAISRSSFPLKEFTPIKKYKQINIEKLETILRKAFLHRRKKIKSSLKDYIEVLKKNNFDLDKRAENLSVHDYCRISVLIN